MEDFQWLWSLTTLKYPKVQPLHYHKVLIRNIKKCVRFKVLTVVLLESQIFCYVMLC